MKGIYFLRWVRVVVLELTVKGEERKLLLTLHAHAYTYRDAKH